MWINRGTLQKASPWNKKNQCVCEPRGVVVSLGRGKAESSMEEVISSNILFDEHCWIKGSGVAIQQVQTVLNRTDLHGLYKFTACQNV